LPEIDYECHRLMQKLQPIANLFFLFLINVVYSYLNAIFLTQSIRLTHPFYSKKRIEPPFKEIF
jgi:hypothetical protein